MTSTKAKGQQYVLECMKLFEQKGYKTWKPGNKAHWIGPGRCVSQSQDILECYDFIAVTQGAPVILVQVTKGEKEGHASERRKKIDVLCIHDEHKLSVVASRLEGKKEFVFWIQDGGGTWNRCEHYTFLDNL